MKYLFKATKRLRVRRRAELRTDNKRLPRKYKKWLKNWYEGEIFRCFQDFGRTFYNNQRTKQQGYRHTSKNLLEHLKENALKSVKKEG